MPMPSQTALFGVLGLDASAAIATVGKPKIKTLRVAIKIVSFFILLLLKAY
jgi:hypothetical protein